MTSSLYVHNLTKAGAKALAVGSSTKSSGADPIAPRRSLTTIAKLEHARRRLMSSFVRGEIVGDKSLLDNKEEKVLSKKPFRCHTTEQAKDDGDAMKTISQRNQSTTESEIESYTAVSPKEDKTHKLNKEENQLSGGDNIAKKHKEKKHSRRSREKLHNVDPSMNKLNTHENDGSQPATKKRKRKKDKHSELDIDKQLKAKTKRGDVADAKLEKKLKKERKRAKREAH